MRLLVLLICLTLASCGSKPSKESIAAYDAKVFENGNISLPYRILLPKEFDAQKRYPLVLVLHGAGERGLDNEAQLTHGSSVFLETQNREKFPAIVVFPQCPEESYWANVNRERSLMTFNFTFYPEGDPTLAMQGLQSLFDQLLQEYQIDRNRIYIGGLSMGGMGTFEFVRRNPGTFAAAFAICGGAHPDTAAKLTDTNWWVFHGDEDMVVDYEHSVEIVNALKEQGAQVKFTTYEGVNHNSWENAFAEPELLPWLFSNQLK